MADSTLSAKSPFLKVYVLTIVIALISYFVEFYLDFYPLHTGKRSIRMILSCCLLFQAVADINKKKKIKYITGINRVVSLFN